MRVGDAASLPQVKKSQVLLQSFAALPSSARPDGILFLRL